MLCIKYVKQIEITSNQTFNVYQCSPLGDTLTYNYMVHALIIRIINQHLGDP